MIGARVGRSRLSIATLATAWIVGVAGCGGSSKPATGATGTSGNGASATPNVPNVPNPAPTSAVPSQSLKSSGGAAGERRVVLFAGTSLTAGLGLDPDSAYPMLIQRKIDSAGLPFEVVNAGVSGETSSGLIDRLDWLLRARFDVLVLETGANDG